MFSKVLVANRGEIACRILRTLRAMGVASVAVHSEVDAFAPPRARGRRGGRASAALRPVGRAICAPTASSRRRSGPGPEAIHPGYGFLSERADFAAACETAGMRFIGPTPSRSASSG